MWLKGMNFLSRKVPTLFFLANHLEGASLWKFGQTREQQGCFWNRSHVRTQPMGGKHKTEKSLQGLCRRQQVMLAFSNELWYTIPLAQGHLPETSAFMLLSKQEMNLPSYCPTTIPRNTWPWPLTNPFFCCYPELDSSIASICHTHSCVHTLITASASGTWK